MEQKIIVNGLLENGGRVLIAKRAISKKIAPGKYHLPGGHVEFGEEPVDAIRREFMEEFGLSVTVSVILRAFSYVDDNVHTVGITCVLVTNDSLDHIKLDLTDNSDVAWVDRRSLANYFAENDHDYTTLRDYFNRA